MVRQFYSRVVFALLTIALIPLEATAVRRPCMSIDEMLEQSQAVFVGTVTDIDDAVGTYDEGMTRVTFAVSETMFGELDSEVDFVMRGGRRGDGTYEEWSSVPIFALGDSYLLFIRKGAYTVQPMVRSSSAILRLVQFESRSALVDEGGLGIAVANDHLGSVKTTGKISQRAYDKRVEQEDAQQSNHAAAADAEGVEPSAIDRASTTAKFFAKLKAVGKGKSRPKQKLAKGRRPQALDNTTGPRGAN